MNLEKILNPIVNEQQNCSNSEEQQRPSWTQEMDEKLNKMYKEKVELTIIASTLNKSEAACHRRWIRINKKDGKRIKTEITLDGDKKIKFILPKKIEDKNKIDKTALMKQIHH